MQPRFFYGHVILALCFINMVFVRGVSGSFGVFYVALLEEFHWSHGVGASIASAQSLLYAMTSPLIGWAFDHLGPRVLMPSAAVLMAIGLFLCGLSDSLWEFYLFYGVIVAVGLGGLGFVSHNALISHWFVRRRGSAIGLAGMGLGLGALLIIPPTQFLISRWGWRTAFMLLGALVLCVTVPMNALFQRRSPKEVGQLPDGKTDPTDGPETSTRARVDRPEWTLGSAVRSLPFWGIAVGHLALGTGLFMVYTHVMAHLVHQGFDKLLAAFLVGLTGFMRTAGTPLWGVVSDRVGRDKAYGIATLITLLGLACLIAIGPDSPWWLLYGFVILYGIGHSAGNPTYGALIGDIFSGRRVGIIFGFLEVTFGLGSSFGAWFGGYVYDLTGSYQWAFALGLVTFVLSYLCVQLSFTWPRNQSQPRKSA